MLTRIHSQGLAASLPLSRQEVRGGPKVWVALCALVASVGLLLAPTGALAGAGYLHMDKGQRAIGRYLLRDVRNGDATGYRFYDCHRYSRRMIVCSADEYQVDYAPIVIDEMRPDAIGLEVIATIGHNGWISVREPGWRTVPFRTR